MRWPHRRDPVSQVPAHVRAALSTSRGERLLGAARAGREGMGHVWLLATTWRMAAVAEEGTFGWARSWHEVDVASWSREAAELTMTFVDARRPLVFPLGQEALFLQVVRERVQASVISSEEVSVPGRRAVRAVLRHDLQTGDVLEQLVDGRGGRVAEDIEAAAAVVFDRLREEVGLAAHHHDRPADGPPSGTDSAPTPGPHRAG